MPFKLELLMKKATVILDHADAETFHKLGLQVTYDPQYATSDLYQR